MFLAVSSLILMKRLLPALLVVTANVSQFRKQKVCKGTKIEFRIDGSGIEVNLETSREPHSSLESFLVILSA